DLERSCIRCLHRHIAAEPTGAVDNDTNRAFSLASREHNRRSEGDSEIRIWRCRNSECCYCVAHDLAGTAVDCDSEIAAWRIRIRIDGQCRCIARSKTGRRERSCNTVVLWQDNSVQVDQLIEAA